MIILKSQITFSNDHYLQLTISHNHLKTEIAIPDNHLTNLEDTYKLNTKIKLKCIPKIDTTIRSIGVSSNALT